VLKISKISKSKPREVDTFKQYVDIIKFIISGKKEKLEVSICFIYRQSYLGKGYDHGYERKYLMDIEIDLLEHDEIYHFNGFHGEDYRERLCCFVEEFIKTLPLQSCSELEIKKLTKQIIDMIIKYCEDKSLYGLTLG
jgi:hypothetical protein